MLNNAINAKKFVFCREARQQMRNDLHLSDNTVVIGHVGRFVEAKNHLFLIDVFADVHRRNPDSVLLLVGDGELRPSIEAAIQENRLQDSVILAGVQSEVAPYYQAMDVFVFPSLYEGLPVSVVEAQAAGLHCCVSSNVPSDAAITDLVEFIPLEYGAERWAEIAINRAQEPRENMLHAIQSAGFDVASTAKWLEDFYIGVATNRG